MESKIKENSFQNIISNTNNNFKIEKQNDLEKLRECVLDLDEGEIA